MQSEIMKEKIKKPFVFLCTGMSLDGKIATFKKKQAEIAINDDKEMRHECRAEADTVIIGARTLRFDDPGLTVKSGERGKKQLRLEKSKEPIKVAVVSDLSSIKKIKRGAFFTRGNAKKILFTTKRTSQKDLKEFRKISDVYVCGETKVNLKKALSKLYELGAKKVMVEGGGELIFSLLKDDLVDEIRLKIGNLILGGRTTTTFVDGRGFTQKEAKQVELVSLTKKDNYIILKCKVIKNSNKPLLPDRVLLED